MSLAAFVLKRILYAVPVLVALVVATFVLIRLAGDPAAMYIVPGMSQEQVANIRKTYGLDRPLAVQFGLYVKSLLSGDLGYSKAAGMSVGRAILKHLPATMELTVFSMVFATMLGIAVGTISAVRRNRLIDHVSRVLALGGVSMPIFWFALLLLTVFYANLGVLPIGRYDPSIWPQSQQHTNIYLLDALLNLSPAQFWDAIKHLLLPGLCLGYLQMALVMRMMRSSMLEVLNEDYVRSARAKGLAEKTVINKHARRNALLPTVTVIGLTFGTMLSGSILTEKVFNWPGMGMWAVRSILNLDSTSIMGYVLATGSIYLLVNIVTDILYSLFDPRVQVA